MGRLRYFGERVLVEDGSAKSDPTTVVNAMLGYRFGKDAWDLRGEVLNLFDSDDAVIAYFYESRFPLPGGGLEPAGVEDIHFRRVEPRAFRVSLTYYF